MILCIDGWKFIIKNDGLNVWVWGDLGGFIWWRMFFINFNLEEIVVKILVLIYIRFLSIVNGIVY